MIKTLLANPPWRKGNKYGVRAGSRWPHFQELPPSRKIPSYIPFPFFLAYAASLLRKHNKDILLIDAVAEGIDEEEFLNRVTAYKPHLVILETSTPSINLDLRITQTVKESLPDVKVALCGPHVSVMKKDFLEQYSFVDYILYGEYELTLLELVNALENNESLSNITGLIFRNASRIVTNPPRPLIENLDSIPWPERDLLPMYNYNDAFAGLAEPNVQMWASRGCPFRCIFCLWPQAMYNNYKYRARNPVEVVKEMEWLISKYNFKAIYFDDDTFDIGKPRILSLCKEIKKKGITTPWSVMARADTLDKETLWAMADAGLYAIKYGVESSDPEILKHSGKNLDLEKVKETVRFTKQAGVKVHLTFTFGLPGETRHTIRKTVDFALALDPDGVQFSVVTPFPGTEYFNQAKRRGYLLTEDWDAFDGSRSAVIRTDRLSKKDLEDSVGYAYARWTAYKNTKDLFSKFKENKRHYLIKAINNPRKAIRYTWQIITH